MPTRQIAALLTASALALGGAVLGVVPAQASGGLVQGTVKFQGGAFADGARVYSIVDTGGGWTWGDSDLVDAAGHYDIGFPPGDVRLLFAAGDGLHAEEFNGNTPSFDDAPIIVIEGGENLTRNATLAVGGEIRGRLLDADGAPIPFVTVGNQYRGAGAYLSTFGVSTDADGRYRIAGLPALKTAIYAYDSTGEYPQRYHGNGWVLGDAKLVAPTLGEVTRGIDIVLPLAAHVSGTVAEQGGSSSPNGRVNFMIQDKSGTWTYVTGVTFVGGTFERGGLPPRPLIMQSFDLSDGSYVSEYYDDKVLIESAHVFDLAPGEVVTGAAVVLQKTTGTIPTGASSFVTTAQVGDVIAAPTAGWVAGAEFRISWRRDGAVIEGETGTDYRVRAADVGHYLQAQVVGFRTGYSSNSISVGMSSPVTEGTLNPVGTPTISGVTKVGRTLTAKPGTWQDGVSFRYRWLRDGAPISGAKAKKKSFTLGSADRGHQISVRVTASKNGYVSAAVESAPTSTIRAAAIAVPLLD